jgi:hypothetical protein
MSYREMQKRLKELEVNREQQERAKALAWARSLSDDELEAWCADYAEREPVAAAAFESMSDEDIDRACDGQMSSEEFNSRVLQARARLIAAGQML